MVDASRERGILTPADREYLRGEKSYDSRQSRYERKRAIRNRVTNAILDWSLLLEHARDETLQDVIDWSDERSQAGARDAIAFVLVTAGGIEPLIERDEPSPALEGDLDRNDWVSTPDAMVRQLLEDGIERAGIVDGWYVREVEPPTVSADFYGADDPLEHLKDGDVSPMDVFRLLENEAVAETTVDAITETLREDLL